MSTALFIGIATVAAFIAAVLIGWGATVAARDLMGR